MTKRLFMGYIMGKVQTTNAFPRISELSTHFNLPRYKISAFLKALSQSGDIVRINNWYRLPGQKLIKDMSIQDEGASNKLADEIVDNPFLSTKLERTTDILPTKSSLLTNLFSWVVFALGIGAAIMSAYYTQVFLAESLNLFFSWLHAILMVSFSVITFGLIALMLSGSIIKHWTKYLLVILFAVLWFCTVSFSMVSTIAGQYTMRVEKEYAQVLETNTASIDMNKIQLQVDARNDLIGRKEEARKRLSGLYEAASIALHTPDKIQETWTSIQTRILATQELILTIDKDIEKTREQERILLQENPLASTAVEKKSTFFQWIAKLFGSDAGMMQFALSLFPSVFLDIISPVLLTLFVFMKNNRKKVEK